MTSQLAGTLAIVSFAAALLFAAIATVYIRRLLRRPATALSEQTRGATTTLSKVRRRQPMTTAEAEFATQLIADRRSPAAYAIPATIFSIGCLYVFGALHQLHGAHPSLRTWIGVLPMFGALNLTAQMLRISHLKGRLRKIERLCEPAGAASQPVDDANRPRKPASL